MSGKRAEEEEDLWTGSHGLTQASPDSGSMLVQLSSSSQHPRGPPSKSDQSTTNPIQLTSSTSGRTELPWYSSGGTEVPTSDHASEVHQSTTNPIRLPSSATGGIERPPYASGGTELPWHSSDEAEPHLLTPGHDRLQLVRPETTKTILPASSVRTKRPSSVRTKPNKWWPPTPEIGPSETSPALSSKILQASSVRTKTNKWVPTTEIEPGDTPPASSSKVLLPSEQITPASSSKVLPPSEQEGYLAQTPTKEPEPLYESILGKLGRKPMFRPLL